MNYYEYIESPQWKSFRDSICRARQFTCEVCKRNFAYAQYYLNLHHLTYERFGHESWEDVQLLCRQCHRDIHNGKEPDKAITWLIEAERVRLGLKEEMPVKQ